MDLMVIKLSTVKVIKMVNYIRERRNFKLSVVGTRVMKCFV